MSEVDRLDTVKVRTEVDRLGTVNTRANGWDRLRTVKYEGRERRGSTMNDREVRERGGDRLRTIGKCEGKTIQETYQWTIEGGKSELFY